MDRHEENIKKEFERTYEELVDQIFRFFVVRLKERDRAKDLAQDTFMRVWKYASHGNEVRNMKALLFATARNLYKNELRARRDVVSLDAYIENSGNEPAAEQMSAEIASEGRRVIARMDTLKPHYRKVLILRFIKGLPVRDIAHLLGETRMAISVRIHRSLQQLRAAHEKGS